jgi:hypothetical protein
MWEEKLHLVERLWEEQPAVILLAAVLFASVMLILSVVAAWQVIRDRRNPPSVIRGHRSRDGSEHSRNADAGPHSRIAEQVLPPDFTSGARASLGGGEFLSRMSADPKAILSAIDAGLPRQARWMLRGTPLDFDFSIDHYALRQVTDSDVVGGPVPEEWSDCRLIGMYDYDEGGGASPWIAIRKSDGFVCGLDVERDEQTTFIFNSSLDRFIRTFNLLDQYLRAGRELPPDIASRVGALDPEAFPLSDWRKLIELITAG